MLQALRWALCAAAVGAAFYTLIQYPDFARYLPAYLGFAAVLASACAVVTPALGDTWPRSARARAAVRIAVPAAALVAAAACFAIDIVAFEGDYPTLHLALFQCGYVLLGLGASRPLRAWRPLQRARRPLAALGVAALGLAPAPFVAHGMLGVRAYPQWAGSSTLGRTQTVFRPLLAERGDGSTRLLSDARAAALFRAHSGLPESPADVDLRNYNVLVMLSEATRYDQTSLARKRLKTTPALVKLRDRGAFSFDRAYAASSGTFQSMSGLFGMSYPSLLPLEVWQKPWTGSFHGSSPAVAELFAEAGAVPFWVGHDKASCFSMTVNGFDRGFPGRELLSPEQSGAADADARIAAAAIHKLRQLHKAKQRFFGFVFFVSPHGPYLPHYRDMPFSTDVDLYRQEVRYLDDQIGKVLRELEKLGRMDDTIVIYSGDHGEEFLDHGARWHKNTVYSEVTHVPLLIWVPGMRGSVQKQPTSHVYLFPWLLQHGTQAMRATASERLRRDIGPMLERTGGAVVTELLGPYKMLSSLIYGDLKLNYDFNSRLHQVFRIDKDPREQRDIFEQAPALARTAVERIKAYRAVRADLRAFVLRPDKKDPRPGARE